MFFCAKKKQKHNEQIKENDTIFSWKCNFRLVKKNTDFCFYTTEMIHSSPEWNKEKKHGPYFKVVSMQKEKNQEISKTKLCVNVCV